MEELTQRLWDLNRNIGQPHRITTIFGRRVTKLYQGQWQTVIEDLDLPHPVIHSRYGHGFAKPYVRDDRLLRTEPATNSVYDYGVHKDIENGCATNLWVKLTGSPHDSPRILPSDHGVRSNAGR